MFVNLW